MGNFKEKEKEHMNIPKQILTERESFYMQISTLIDTENMHPHVFIADDHIPDLPETYHVFILTRDMSKKVKKKNNYFIDLTRPDWQEVFVQQYEFIIEGVKEREKIIFNFQDMLNTDCEIKNKMAGIDANIALARDLQRYIVKNNHIISDFYVFFQPFEFISGDFFFTTETSTSIYMCIGDVTDHGFHSGLYAASLYTLISTYFAITPPIGYSLEDLAKFVEKQANTYRRDNKESATVLFVEIDKQNSLARFISFGHGAEPPIIINKRTKKAEKITLKNTYPPLGDIHRTNALIPDEVPYTLKNNALLIYTDGIKELFKKEEKTIAGEYGINRMINAIEDFLSTNPTVESTMSRALVKHIVNDANNYSLISTLREQVVQDYLNNLADDVTIACLY